MVGVGSLCIIGVIVGEQFFPGLGGWAVVGAIPLAGASGMWITLRRGNRSGFVLAVTVASVMFIGFIVAFPAIAIEPQKAPKELVRMSGVGNPHRELRLGCFEWLLPSVVYYSGREVKAIPSPDQVVEFLAIPTPAYVFVAETTWNNSVARKVTVPCRIIARHYDFLEKGNIIVVTNEMNGDAVTSRK
jgi:hypothetical protein